MPRFFDFTPRAVAISPRFSGSEQDPSWAPLSETEITKTLVGEGGEEEGEQGYSKRPKALKIAAAASGEEETAVERISSFSEDLSYPSSEMERSNSVRGNLDILHRVHTEALKRQVEVSEESEALRLENVALKRDNRAWKKENATLKHEFAEALRNNQTWCSENKVLQEEYTQAFLLKTAEVFETTLALEKDVEARKQENEKLSRDIEISSQKHAEALRENRAWQHENRVLHEEYAEHMMQSAEVLRENLELKESIAVSNHEYARVTASNQACIKGLVGKMGKALEMQSPGVVVTPSPPLLTDEKGSTNAETNPVVGGSTINKDDTPPMRLLKQQGDERFGSLPIVDLSAALVQQQPSGTSERDSKNRSVLVTISPIEKLKEQGGNQGFEARGGTKGNAPTEAPAEDGVDALTNAELGQMMKSIDAAWARKGAQRQLEMLQTDKIAVGGAIPEEDVESEEQDDTLFRVLAPGNARQLESVGGASKKNGSANDTLVSWGGGIETSPGQRIAGGNRRRVSTERKVADVSEKAESVERSSLLGLGKSVWRKGDTDGKSNCTGLAEQEEGKSMILLGCGGFLSGSKKAEAADKSLVVAAKIEEDRNAAEHKRGAAKAWKKENEAWLQHTKAWQEADMAFKMALDKPKIVRSVPKIPKKSLRREVPKSPLLYLPTKLVPKEETRRSSVGGYRENRARNAKNVPEMTGAPQLPKMEMSENLARPLSKKIPLKANKRGHSIGSYIETMQAALFSPRVGPAMDRDESDGSSDEGFE